MVNVSMLVLSMVISALYIAQEYQNFSFANLGSLLAFLGGGSVLKSYLLKETMYLDSELAVDTDNDEYRLFFGLIGGAIFWGFSFYVLSEYLG